MKLKIDTIDMILAIGALALLVAAFVFQNEIMGFLSMVFGGLFGGKKLSPKKLPKQAAPKEEPVVDDADQLDEAIEEESDKEELADELDQLSESPEDQ